MPTSRKPSEPDPGSILAWQILTPVTTLFFVLLVFSAFVAREQFEPLAVGRDLARAERYAQFAAVVFGERLPETDAGPLLEEFWATGLDTLEFIPPEGIPEWASPRFVADGPFVDAWATVRTPEGKVLGAVSLHRQADALVFVRRAILSFTVASCVVFALLALLAWLLFKRRVADRLRSAAREIAPAAPGAGPHGDAIDEVRAANEIAQAQARMREEPMRRLLEGHTEMACLSTPEGTILEVNDAYCRFFGKQRENLVGSNYLDLIPPSERTDALTSVQKLSRAKPENFAEHRVLLTDGSARWMRWRDTALFRDDGTIGEILSYGTDISREKILAGQIDGLKVAFAQMQSLAETGSLTWDFGRDVMEWTTETRRLLGANDTAPASLEALLGAIAPDDREAVRRLFLAAREEGKDFQHEFRAVLPDGSLRVLQGRAEVLADPKTKILNQLTCTLRDITALREAEASIRRGLRFREAIETSLAAGIVVSDDKGRNIFVNPAFCEMTGWPKEDLVGISAPYPYWPEEEIPAILKAFDAALAGQTPPQGYELRFCRKDGKRFDVLIKVAPLLDSDDKRLGWLAVVSDISSIQQTRRELLQAEAAARQELLYRQAIEKATTVGLIAIDQKGRPISINEAYCKMLGYSKEEIMAMSAPYPFWPDEEREQIEEAFALHLAGQTPPEGFTLRFLKKDGTPIDLLITAAPIHDAQGEQIGVLSVLTDITPLQEAQRQLRTANERLRIAQDVAEFGIWDWDPLNNTLHWDRQSFALFGHPDATDAHEVWSKIHSEETQEQLTYELERLIAAGGKSGQDRIHARWPDGTIHEILSTYIIMRDEAGKAVRVLGVNRDITAEVEEERELRNADERLAAALEGGQFGTFEHIIGVGDVNWSAANYEINGIDPSITDPEELFAVWKQGAGSFFPDLMARMEAMPVNENHLTYEFTAHPPGREPRRVRSSVFIERNKQGHPVRLVGITRRVD